MDCNPDRRVTGKASDEVSASEESSDDQMRLSARNQVLSLTLQFLVYASDRTTGTKWLLSPKTSYLHSRQKQ